VLQFLKNLVAVPPAVDRGRTERVEFAQGQAVAHYSREAVRGLDEYFLTTQAEQAGQLLEVRITSANDAGFFHVREVEAGAYVSQGSERVWSCILPQSVEYQISVTPPVTADGYEIDFVLVESERAAA
jgi:hypothetical protein